MTRNVTGNVIEESDAKRLPHIRRRFRGPRQIGPPVLPGGCAVTAAVLSKEGSRLGRRRTARHARQCRGKAARTARQRAYHNTTTPKLPTGSACLGGHDACVQLAAPVVVTRTRRLAQSAGVSVRLRRTGRPSLGPGTINGGLGHPRGRPICAGTAWPRPRPFLRAPLSRWVGIRGVSLRHRDSDRPCRASKRPSQGRGAERSKAEAPLRGLFERRRRLKLLACCCRRRRRRHRRLLVTDLRPGHRRLRSLQNT